MEDCKSCERSSGLSCNETADVESRKNWLVNHQPCAACRARASSDAGLAVLEGPSGQTTWAADIRLKMISDIEKIKERALARGDEGHLDEWSFRIYSEAVESIECLKAIADARWFIQHESDSSLNLLDSIREAVKEVQDSE